MSDNNPGATNRAWLKRLLALALVSLGLALAISFGRDFLYPRSPESDTVSAKAPRQLVQAKNISVWWDSLPAPVQRTTMASAEQSNIDPASYAGPESCKDCHAKNYEGWSSHPHRWMNMPANETTVKGDFSGKASMLYRGGKVDFTRAEGRYLQHLERDGQERVYQVTQTIGSRFFQYYVGKQIKGPEPREHAFYHDEHLLPFGYWLVYKEWVPVVHIGPEVSDQDRPDPFAPDEESSYHAVYARSCNYCHTTFALGDLLSRRPQQMGEHAFRPLTWSLGSYLKEARPQEVAALEQQLRESHDRRENPLLGWDAAHYAVTFGVSCEACHLGAREHVDSRGKIPPKFFPASPHLRVQTAEGAPDFGRSHDNVNWACGRCHTGPRSSFAAGMSTWNSVEYADAMRGSCYSKLRCIDCHNPHQPIGPRWSLSADRDDGLCLRCHEQFQPAQARLRHTHHAEGSEGARCMNCHMPRINEGIEDVVRTHMIYSPTRRDMLEAGHPNACNLCHADQPIDWTLRHLKEWYGTSYDEGQIAANYPQRGEAVGKVWLKSANASVRLVAAEAMTRKRDFAALPELLGTLDDPYLVNRQFAYKGLEEMLKVRLPDFGYRFYQTKSERQKPLAELRAKFCPSPKP